MRVDAGRIGLRLIVGAAPPRRDVAESKMPAETRKQTEEYVKTGAFRHYALTTIWV